MRHSIIDTFKRYRIRNFLFLVILILYFIPLASSTEQYLTWKVEDPLTFGYIEIENFPETIELGKTYKINGIWSLETLSEGDSVNFTHIEWIVQIDSETQTLGYSAINGSLSECGSVGFKSHWTLKEHFDGNGSLWVNAAFLVDNSPEAISDIEIIPLIEIPYKVTTKIELDDSEYDYLNGENVTIKGKLTPSINRAINELNEAIIELNYTKPDGSKITRISKTDDQGEFNDTFKPDALGLWRVQAIWSGTKKYTPAISDPIAFQTRKNEPTIALNIKNTSDFRGKKIEVYGEIYPSVPNASIVLNFSGLNGSNIMTKIVSVGKDASFSSIHYADTLGVWQVQASWVGSETHTRAISYPIGYEVTSKDLWLLILYYFIKYLLYFAGFVLLYIILKNIWRISGKRTITIKP